MDHVLSRLSLPSNSAQRNRVAFSNVSGSWGRSHKKKKAPEPCMDEAGGNEIYVQVLCVTLNV